jgi:hypothetical protein
LEDLRKHEGMRRPWLKGRAKGLNENLAPLRRYLQSNVGRPWDKVYSEVCQRINRDSAVQLHVWQHLMQDVCRDPHVVRGEVHGGRGIFRFFRFFVDPCTGLLRENKIRGWPWRNEKVVKDKPLDRIKIDETHECRLLAGIWYELELSPLPEGVSAYDLVLRKAWPHDGADVFVKFYGRRVYAVRKRQLNTREIRRMLQSK